MFAKRESAELESGVVRLRTRVAELEGELAKGVRLDPITGVLSAPAFRALVAEEVERARRYQRPLSLAVIAIDDLDALELHHGFRAGDELLVAFAERISAATRTHDRLGRIAAGEFALLLPETDARGALPSLERLLVELENAGGGGISAHGSMGLAGLEREMSVEGLVSLARGACTEAQAAGGGRAVLARSAAEQLEVAPPQRDAVEALALALLERDRYTGEHSEAVIEISASVARNLGCTPEEVAAIRSAALLHDVGKVAIPDEILHKAGPLDEAEWKLMREHPVIGERILRVLPGMGAVARIVRHEHERWDGQGYPDGLAGEAIPLGSRIIIAADTYHAITSDRPYRAAGTHQRAVEELSRCAGTQFDPRVTEALIGVLYGQRQGLRAG